MLPPSPSSNPPAQSSALSCNDHNNDDQLDRSSRIAIATPDNPSLIASSQTPQLSERDSIWATHYDDDASANLPSPARTTLTPTSTSSMATSLLPMQPIPLHPTPFKTAKHDIFVFGRPNSTLDPYQYQNSQPAPLSPLHVHAGILPKHISPLPSLPHPADLSILPQASLQNSIATSSPLFDPGSQERLKYRSWRQGQPMFTGKTMANPEAAEDDEAQDIVDKKIEATLPRPEQKTNARSRKTSHYLGLFLGHQDDQANQDLHQAREVNRSIRLQNTHTLENHAKSIHSPPFATPSNALPDLPIPSRSRSKTAQSHSPRPGANSSVSTQNKQELILTNDTISAASLPHSSDKQDRNHVHSTDDDFAPEHISSAVYYPHPAVDDKSRNRARSSARKEQQALQQDSSVNVQSSKNKSQSRSRLSSQQQNNGIDFAIQSRDESQFLHGDLPEAAHPISHASHDIVGGPPSDFASTSESEWSADDDLTLDEDLGGNVTPRPGAVWSQKIGQPKAQPPQAIKLKPYGHQVGGHTTMYRFSRRAVCKQLNNKENKFYEVVERYHPQLLDFLPR